MPFDLSDDLWLVTFLQAILDSAAAALADLAPARRFVSPGLPVPDCSQLSVHLVDIRPAQIDTQTQSRPHATKEAVAVADVMVVLYRCVPGLIEGAPSAPSAGALDGEGKAMAQSAQRLLFGLMAAALGGTLVPANVLTHPSVLFRAAEQITPQAGLAGWRMTMEVKLA